MTQNKPFAERRDAAAQEEMMKAQCPYVGVSMLEHLFIKGANFGYSAALEDMWPLMNEANVALITLEADGSKWNSLRNALDLFAKLKKEIEGEG